MGSVFLSTSIAVIVKGASKDRSRLVALVKTRAEMKGYDDMISFSALPSIGDNIPVSEGEPGGDFERKRQRWHQIMRS